MVSLLRQGILKIYKHCEYYATKFMDSTSLHGLKFVSDSSISIWERAFFLLSFIVATGTVAGLISNIYAKWDSTPVIIGISPKATSIGRIPFPAVTICNMNQAQLSLVKNYTQTSFEYALIKFLCNSDAEIKYDEFVSNNASGNRIRIPEFVATHAQPCEHMLVACKFGALDYNCKDLFRDVLTDEGICCVFNVLPSEYLYRVNYSFVRDLAGGDDAVPVDWNPQDGYPDELPNKYYPRPAVGTGITLGLTVILNAEIDEYLCSSTNGPGFKISLHNPIETPQVKETGLIVPIGYETRFRIDPLRSEAVSSLRSVSRNSRQCLFNDEKKLLYYKPYSRRNCENECFSKHYLETCGCVPFNMPLIYSNASICTVRDNFCLQNSTRSYLTKSLNARVCRGSCLPSCFDLAYLPDTFSGPLAKANFSIPSEVLSKMPRDEMIKNMAVVHMYYRESVLYADLKNIYIGFTEFLSNIGGVLGLFTGFSVISVAEILYFSIIRPLFDRKRALPDEAIKVLDKPTANQNYNNWLSSELRKPTPKPKLLLGNNGNNKWAESNVYSK